MRDEPDQAYELALQGLALSRETGYRFGSGWAARLLGQVALARGAFVTAVKHLREALVIFTDISARFEMGRTYLVLSELAYCQGAYQEASMHIEEALALFTTSQAPAYINRAAHRARELASQT